MDEIVVIDVAGRIVASPLREVPYPAGFHTFEFSPERLASGIYFYRLVHATNKLSRFVVLTLTTNQE